MNWLIRLAYRLGHRTRRVVWWVTRPAHRGSLVALWADGKILLVKNSYRRPWNLPGGGIEGDETPEQAAIRELREELGIAVREDALRLEREATDEFEHRHDSTYLFSVALAVPPILQIDRREIVEARFVTRKAALELELVPALACYLREAASP